MKVAHSRSPSADGVEAGVDESDCTAAIGSGLFVGQGDESRPAGCRKAGACGAGFQVAQGHRDIVGIGLGSHIGIVAHCGGTRVGRRDHPFSLLIAGYRIPCWRIVSAAAA